MFSRNSQWIIASLAGLMLLDCALAQTNFTCIQCSDSEDCLKNVGAVTEMITCEDTKECFTRINDNGIVTRDCLTAEAANGCIAPNCISCKDNSNCNKNNLCKSCSSDTEAACAQTDASAVKNAICASATSKCMISVLQSKTERGCATDEFEKTCTDAKKCKLCEGSACNLGIFPPERRTCFQCDDTNAMCANAQQTNSGIALACLQYDADDKCYMYGSDETHATRGCTSDVSEKNKCANSADAKCKICNADNCNDWGYSVDQSLLCVTCSSASDPQCVWGQAASSAKRCAKKLVYTQEEKCYTHTDANGVVTRGCFHDLEEAAQTACTTENKCVMCNNANGCNNIDANNFTCIRCRSDNFAACRDGAKDMSGEGCRNSVTSEADAKCYSGIWRNDLVIRGCLIDLEAIDKAICNDPDNKACEVCSGSNCNNKTNNGAAYLLISNGFLAIALFMLWRLQ